MTKKTSKNGNGNSHFWDTLAIYYSSEDKCWIAHSLRTDQFGTGDCVLDALVDGMKAVDQVVELAQKKSGIKVLREAPEEIQEIAKNATPLPDEISEIAHKMLFGKWPQELPAEFKAEHSKSFKKRILEEAVA